MRLQSSALACVRREGRGGVRWSPRRLAIACACLLLECTRDSGVWIQTQTTNSTRPINLSSDTTQVVGTAHVTRHGLLLLPRARTGADWRGLSLKQETLPVSVSVSVRFCSKRRRAGPAPPHTPYGSTINWGWLLSKVNFELNIVSWNKSTFAESHCCPSATLR